MRFRVTKGTLLLGDGKKAVAGDIVDLPASMQGNTTLEAVSEDKTPTREVAAAPVVTEELKPDHEWKRRKK